MTVLSIIIPVYNEEATIESLLLKVFHVDYGVPYEVIVVDDGSTDKSLKVLRRLQEGFDFVLLTKRNEGKGSALKMGLQSAKGSVVITQDADCEYDPQDIPGCVRPIIAGVSHVVYGSRRLKKNKQYSHFGFLLGGVGLTWLFNMLYCQRLTDLPTGYKAYRADILKMFVVHGNDWRWEYEVTPKIVRKGYIIDEVPISYYPRSVNEGKKIKVIDGFRCAWELLRWRFKKIH